MRKTEQVYDRDTTKAIRSEEIFEYVSNPKWKVEGSRGLKTIIQFSITPLSTQVVWDARLHQFLSATKYEFKRLGYTYSTEMDTPTRQQISSKRYEIS